MTNKNIAITPSKFSVTKVSRYGVSNKIMARLFIQMLNLFELTDKETEELAQIKENLLKLSHSLLYCYDIKQNLEQEYYSELKKIKSFDSSYIQNNPYINNLESLVETFLYQSKNYLRDLGTFLKLFYPNFNFPETPFSSKKEKNIFTNLLIREKPHLEKVFCEDMFWINELISKRNAVEHPRGYSGKLIIKNFQNLNFKKIIPPIWFREKDDEIIISVTDILQDISVFMENLLTFSEDIIIHYCIEDNFVMKNIIIYEISEENRNKNCPIRFDVTIAKV